ncbi:hypothetical protein HYU94_02410 [Candidatus Daviesbacteria bacterium]|nr:hypothetical protein [Candidatus Daviesbacteria bacterium]
MKQKGFTLILVIIGILVLAAVAGGAYYFGKSQISQPTITPASSPDETANWKTYTNTEYGYLVRYPSLLDQNEIKDNDTYLNLVNFRESGQNGGWFSITVRNSTLEDEIKYQKSQIEGHVLVKLARETKVIIEGFPGVLLEYTPDQPNNGSTTRFVIVNNRKHSFIISGKPQILDQILSTFRFD